MEQEKGRLGHSRFGRSQPLPCPFARNGIADLIRLSQKAASRVIPKFADLHVDPISRLYTIKSFRAKLGSKALPGVILSERDCRVLVTYLAGKGHSAIEGDVSQTFCLVRN